MKQKVYFEATPNPATMKFLLGTQVTEASFECGSIEDTDASPLATKLFGFPWTSAVFIGNDFITITKQDWVEWNILTEPLCRLIQDHLDKGEPVVLQGSLQANSTSTEAVTDSADVKKIKKILDKEIRPAVQLDGGDIQYIDYHENILYVRMKGACSGCPSSNATLKNGIEVRMKEAIPELLEVKAL